MHGGPEREPDLRHQQGERRPLVVCIFCIALFVCSFCLMYLGLDIFIDGSISRFKVNPSVQELF